MRSTPGCATGTTTLRGALAGRARSRPGRTACVPGRCAAADDAMRSSSLGDFNGGGRISSRRQYLFLGDGKPAYHL